MTHAETGPRLIDGGLHSDDRGTVSFVNDFDFTGVDRFYALRPLHTNTPRGWVGHRREHKWFTALHGTVRVAVVEPDDWESPSQGLDVSRFTLSDQKPQVLCVPPGHATGCAAISDGAVLLVFSSGSIHDVPSDDYRFPVDRWGIVD
jgi:dTDP-4-dehydrorhamnose 3,5-epimerase-like enzyme